MNRARAVAWAAFILGVAASIAANVAHARPQWGPRLAAGFAPVALLAVIEMLARVPWPAGARWRAGKWLGAAVVAGVAAVTSYRPMSALLLGYGEDELAATIPPPAVRGVMVVASVALLAMGRSHVAGPSVQAKQHATRRPAAEPAQDRASVEMPGPATEAGPAVEAAPALASAPAPVRAPAPKPRAAEPAPVRNRRQPNRQRPAAEVAEEARQMYLASIAAGDPLTGRQIGEMYQRSPTWGRERITEAKRAESDRTEAGRAKAERTDAEPAATTTKRVTGGVPA